MPRGAKPAELPREQPTRVQLIVNQTLAKAMGRRVRQSMLRHADWHHRHADGVSSICNMRK